MSLKAKQHKSLSAAPAQKPILMDADMLAWEREVYEADPTGGDPAKF